MEILIIVLVAAGVGYWMYKNVYKTQDSKQENNGVTAVGEPPATVAVEGAGAVSWHTAPPAGSALASNTLDVNHDGKVDLEDVKEVVKKVRAKAADKKPAAKKPAAKKPAAKKPAAMTATGEKKPRAPRKPKASS